MGEHDRTFTIAGTVPIPVGHRVEVVVFERDVGTFVAEWQPAPQQPLVRDLDTGIVFGRPFHFTSDTMFGESDVAPLEPLATLRTFDRVVGRVLVCRVLEIESHGTWHQTTLVVAPDPESDAGAYR